MMLTNMVRMSAAVVAVLVAGGCAAMPSGPSVLVLPGPGKSFENFQADDYVCRRWAEQQIGGTAQQTANESTAKGAAVGTVVGAGAGALLGAAAGHAGAGAAIGAGSGLLVGTAAGGSAGQEYGGEMQQRYDFAYIQCMYSKDNDVPGAVHRYRIRKSTPPPPPPSSVPPDYVPPQ